RAVSARTPTLAFCSSARALAAAFDGVNAPVAEFRPGPALLARRDASTDDPLFGAAPMVLDVVAWRHEELREPPPAATLLAASPHGAPEIFRLGDRSWGIQSHVEFDAEMVRGLGGDEALARRVEGIEDHLADTWKPIVERFVALAEGRTAGTPLPLLPN
ncbi:MAG TPA: hypothetical protein VE172_18680, partial [Stackebrandtia sp.]|uniref:hypothetical protein n=1 Tax=Stackebrandtia sp. TaxID=2023065 RepID=UPI002D68D4D4